MSPKNPATEFVDLLNKDPLKLAEAGVRLQQRRLRKLFRKSERRKPAGLPPGVLLSGDLLVRIR